MITALPVGLRLSAGMLKALKLGLFDLRSETSAIACLVPLLLMPALWNGFPIIYYDTGAYALEGLGGHFIVERSPVYSLFLRWAGAGANLWLIVLIQSAAVAFTMVQCARTLAPWLPVGIFVLFSAVLVVATGLPWYVGQVEPDCFTALVVLTSYLLAFHGNTLGRLRAALLLTLGGFAVAMHPSHILLALFLMISLAVARVLRRPIRDGRCCPNPRLLEPALVCFLGLALILAGNFYFTRQVFVSRAGAPFVFARMLQDGIVMRLLDDTCPKSAYRLCSYRDSLPPTADGWLWTSRSPFFQLGHFEGTAAESERIVRDSLIRYPFLQLQAAANDAAAQFVRFGTGDQIEPQEWVLAPVFKRFFPAQVGAYLAARQQRGELDFRSISRLHVAIGLASLAGIVVLLCWSIRARRPSISTFLSSILTALMGNAIICGVLSGPHDRYQSRLIWIASFALLLSAALASKDKPAPVA